jgi:hypothetical protein
VFMRYVLLFLFLPVLSFGQKRIPPSSYEYRMDSLAIAHFKINYSKSVNRDVIFFRPIERVKLSFSSHINPTVNNRNYAISVFNSNTGFLEFYDLTNIITYDIRLKVYVIKKISLLGRCFVNGNKPDTRLYTIGVQIKF